MRLLEALHKTNRPPHCIDTDVRAAACWRSCCIKKCRKRKYAGGLNVEYVKNVERKVVEQFNFDGWLNHSYATCATSSSASSILHVPAAPQHPATPTAITVHTFARGSAECSMRGCVTTLSAERRHVIIVNSRSPPHVALRLCDVMSAKDFDLARRLGRGGLEPDCGEEVERKMGREGA